MHETDNKTSRADLATLARLRAVRRAERFDIIIASTLLLFLIFGWAIRFAPVEQWPRGDFLLATNSRHV